MRWLPMQIVGAAYADDALPWSHQDTLNYIPVPAEKEGVRSSAMLRGVPGLTPFSDLGTSAPIRGARNVEGRLFVISGQSLFRVNTDGTSTVLGAIPGVTRCSLSHNQITGGNEVAISNGQSGYVYNTVTGVLAQITDEGFPGSICFESLDSYILGIEPGRRFAFTSDLASAGSYNTLDRYEAEGSPDLLVGMAVTHREWWLMGERTIEPFTNTGETTGTFQRSQGTVIEVGLAAIHAVAVVDNSVFWLGNDGIVYRANGYTPQRISTHAIEQAIARCNIAQAFAFTWDDRGHKVFYLTFPDGRTWGYDAATGEWHRRGSYGLDRWRLNTLTRWNGQWIGGDYSNGKLYRLDWAVQHEDGAALERRRITGVTHDNHNNLIINGFALDVDTGRESPVPLRLTGDLPGGYIGDGGSTQYAASGGIAPYAVTLLSGSFPPGASMDATGLVTYAYTTAGAYAWTVRATDAFGVTVDLTDSATITNAIPSLALGETALGVYRLVPSADGVDWSATPIVATGLTIGTSLIVLADGRYAAWSTGAFAQYSDDGGLTWTSTSITGAAGPTQGSIAGTALLVARGTHGIDRSTDNGSTYTAVTAAPSSTFLATLPGLAVSIYDSGGVVATGYSTDDGATWSTGPNLASTDHFRCPTAGHAGASGNSLCAFGGWIADSATTDQGPAVAFTADGQTYRVVQLATSVTQQVQAVAYGRGVWVAGCNDGAIYWSDDDGATWTLSDDALGVACETLAHNGIRFVAGGSSAGVSAIASSSDGVSWTPHTSALTYAVHCFALEPSA